MLKSALCSTVLTALAFCASGSAWRAEAATYLQTDLVSDIPGLATITDANLQNSWGISHSSTSPFWISNQVTNTATLYAVTGSTNVTKANPNANGFVAIPTTASGPQGPTGQVFNTNTSASSFPVGNGGNGASAHFIFANLNGTISAWDTGATAFIQVPTTGASYTGLAINTAGTQLYAVDNKAGSINVFNSNFAPVSSRRRRICNPRHDQRAESRPVQRAEYQRQHLCDLRAGRAPSPNNCRPGARSRGGFQ